MIQYRSLAVLPPPYNKNIYHFHQCNRDAFNVYIHTDIYLPPPPHALNVFSLHTCVSRPRDTRVLLCTYVYLHSNIHIYIHTYTRVWTTRVKKPINPPPRLELRHCSAVAEKRWWWTKELETAVVDYEYQAVSVFAGGAPVDLAPCPSMDFTCSDGSCILKSSVCDGFDDCPRAEDELHCGI